jgi:hypothetical protein
MTNQVEVKANQAFYHDLTGARANGEIFQTDQDTYNKLQEAGYVQKLDLSAEGQKLAQEYAKSQQQMGQEQAKANEAVSQAHHVQNMEANQHTESINQDAAQRAQNAQTPNQADQQVAEQKANQFEPAATFNTKATAKKANDTK